MFTNRYKASTTHLPLYIYSTRGHTENILTQSTYIQQIKKLSENLPLSPLTYAETIWFQVHVRTNISYKNETFDFIKAKVTFNNKYNIIHNGWHEWYGRSQRYYWEGKLYISTTNNITILLNSCFNIDRCKIWQKPAKTANITTIWDLKIGIYNNRNLKDTKGTPKLISVENKRTFMPWQKPKTK